MITAIVIATFLVSIVISLVLWGTFLRFGLRWIKAKNVTVRRIAYTTVLISVINITIEVLSRFYNPGDLVVPEKLIWAYE